MKANSGSPSEQASKNKPKSLSLRLFGKLFARRQGSSSPLQPSRDSDPCCDAIEDESPFTAAYTEQLSTDQSREPGRAGPARTHVSATRLIFKSGLSGLPRIPSSTSSSSRSIAPMPSSAKSLHLPRLQAWGASADGKAGAAPAAQQSFPLNTSISECGEQRLNREPSEVSRPLTPPAAPPRRAPEARDSFDIPQPDTPQAAAAPRQLAAPPTLASHRSANHTRESSRPTTALPASGGSAPQPLPPAETLRHLQAARQHHSATLAAHLGPGSPFATGPAPDSEGSSTLIAVGAGAPPSMLRPAWRMCDYAVSGRLYKGDMSAVYKARCRLSGARVVLKVYDLRSVPYNTMHALAREVRIHSELAHENILKLYGAFEEDERLVLVLERAARGDLFSLHRGLPGCRMGEEQLQAVVLVPLLSALAHLHARGVCHRDIKPENILMSNDWQLRLADFGASIDLSQERAVTRTGTVDYMAPEVARCPLKSQPEENKNVPGLAYSTAADVWGVGVLAFEMLVGFPPFISLDCGTRVAAPVIGGARGAARSGAVQFPHFISAGARDFIAQALAERPGDRPTAAQLLRHPWMKAALRACRAAAASAAVAAAAAQRQRQQQLRLQYQHGGREASSAQQADQRRRHE